MVRVGLIVLPVLLAAALSLALLSGEQGEPADRVTEPLSGAAHFEALRWAVASPVAAHEAGFEVRLAPSDAPRLHGRGFEELSRYQREWVAGVLAFSRFGLLPVEIDCLESLGGQVECEARPESLLSEHPFHDYSTDALEAMVGEPIALQVLSLRLGFDDPHEGLAYAIEAAGLSGGRSGPLVELQMGSDWVATHRDGEPAEESLKQSYVLFEAARRLGHTMVDPGRKLELIGREVPWGEREQLDAQASRIVASVRAIEPAEDWD